MLLGDAVSAIMRGVEQEVKAACIGTTLKAARHERTVHLQKWLDLPGFHSKWSLVGARYSNLVTAIVGESGGVIVELCQGLSELRCRRF